MNIADYQQAGYAMSNYIEPAIVTKAENDVIGAYIVPLIGHIPTDEEKAAEPLKTAIMSLAFLLIEQRNIMATRAGAKTKNSPQSGTPTADDILRQNAPSCAKALKAIAGDKQPSKECADICGIYFRTNYFHN